MAWAGAVAAFGLATVGVFLAGGRVRIPPSAGWLFRCGLAIAGAILALGAATGGRLAGRVGRRESLVLVGFGVLGALSYFEFGAAYAPWRYHRGEMFHHALGSKYAEEVGYTRLYVCALRAEAELLGRAAIEQRLVRDLRTNQVFTGADALRVSDECVARFSPPRWREFVEDVRRLRGAIPVDAWTAALMDHGYNAPPAWTVWARTLTARLPLSERALRALALCDLLLLSGTFAALWWGFGLRVTCIALVFWGCQFPAMSAWTIGAFLRQDWLFFLTLSISAARRRRYGLSGAAWMFASLLRVFPVVLGIGVIVLGASQWWRGAIGRGPRRFLGAALIVLCLSTAATVSLLGVASHRELVDHLRVFAGTPLTNRMGLRTVLSYADDDDDAFSPELPGQPGGGEWGAARRARLAERWPLYALLTGALLCGFAVTVARTRVMWVAMALSVALLPVVTDLTCYYYSFFLLAATLARLSPEVAVLLLGVAGLSPILGQAFQTAVRLDMRYLRESILFIALGVALIAALWPGLSSGRGRTDPAGPPAD